MKTSLLYEDHLPPDAPPHFRKFGIIVSDFGVSWRDGMAFLALIHCVNPRLVNLQVLLFLFLELL